MKGSLKKINTEKILPNVFTLMIWFNENKSKTRVKKKKDFLLQIDSESDAAFSVEDKDAKKTHWFMSPQLKLNVDQLLRLSAKTIRLYLALLREKTCNW